MANWKNIHQDFAEKYYWFEDKTWQQAWEEKGFTYLETQEWVKVGLKPKELEFVSFLKKEGLTPSQYANLSTESAQEWLDYLYSKEAKKEVTNLNIGSKKLEGDLVVTNWPNLKWITCSNNSLNSLTINNLPQLIKIDCSCNKLTINNCPQIKRFIFNGNRPTDLTFLNHLNPEKLVKLNISDNGLVAQDLSFLSRFINLRWLELAGNKFTGSLEPLYSLTKLKGLNIRWTNINDGLEYLPACLLKIDCVACRYYNNSWMDREIGGSYQSWRESNKDLVGKAQKVIELRSILTNLNSALVNQNLVETTDKALQIFIFESEERVKEWRKEIEQIKKQQLQAQIETFPKKN